MAADGERESGRARHARSAVGRYVVYLAALFVGCAVAVLVCHLYITFYIKPSLRPYAWMLGYTLHDYGTPWRWTFTLMLWGTPALPLCRILLGFIDGCRPSWRKLLGGYALLGILLYLFGIIAYRTDIDRYLLIAAGLCVVLTAGYAVTARWVLARG